MLERWSSNWILGVNRKSLFFFISLRLVIVSYFSLHLARPGMWIWHVNKKEPRRKRAPGSFTLRQKLLSSGCFSLIAFVLLIICVFIFSRQNWFPNRRSRAMRRRSTCDWEWENRWTAREPWPHPSCRTGRRRWNPNTGSASPETSNISSFFFPFFPFFLFWLMALCYHRISIPISDDLHILFIEWLSLSGVVLLQMLRGDWFPLVRHAIPR